MPKKPAKGAHPLPKASEEMKHWSALLGTEMESWPGVTSKPMFGMTAYYKGEQIFAVLPKTRAFGSTSGVAFRFEQISEKLAKELKQDERVITNPIGKRWITFELRETRDVNAALEWMMRAEAAVEKKVGLKKSAAKKSRRTS